MGLNAPETSAPAESSSSGVVSTLCRLMQHLHLLAVLRWPVYRRPSPHSSFMSGFPPGYVTFSTFLSLGSHDLALDHYLPDFQASHQVILLSHQGMLHSHLHPSSLLECRRLAIFQVALQVYSPRLRLLIFFPHKQIKANRFQRHLPYLQRRKSARNLPFISLKSGYDSRC